MKIVVVALGALALSACMESRPAPMPAPVGACDAALVQALIGKPANPSFVEKVRRQSGSALARRITPEMRVTMDFRADRVNVWVSTNGTAERITCG